MPKQSIPVYIDTPDEINADTTPTFTQVPIGHIPHIRNKYTFSTQDMQHSENRGVSMTIPNETYTIRELLEKHTRGIMPDVTMKAMYVEAASHDDLDLMKAQRLDIAEKQQLQLHQTSIIEQLEQQVKHDETKKQTEAKQKAEAKREQNGDSDVEK